MSNGWEKFHKYVGVQGVLAVALTGTIIYLSVAQLPIPEVLVGLAGAACGFYFAKNGPNLVNAARGVT